MRGTGWEITRRPDGSVLLELEQCAPVPGVKQGFVQVTTCLHLCPQPFVDRMLSLVAGAREEAAHAASLQARKSLDLGLCRPPVLRRLRRWVVAYPLLVVWVLATALLVLHFYLWGRP